MSLHALKRSIDAWLSVEVSDEEVIEAARLENYVSRVSPKMERVRFTMVIASTPSSFDPIAWFEKFRRQPQALQRKSKYVRPIDDDSWFGEYG